MTLQELLNIIDKFKLKHQDNNVKVNSTKDTRITRKTLLDSNMSIIAEKEMSDGTISVFEDGAVFTEEMTRERIEEYMNIDNFQMISWFNDISVLPYLGEAIHTITEPVLMDIRNVVNRYDKVEEQRHTLVSPHKYSICIIMMWLLL